MVDDHCPDSYRLTLNHHLEWRLAGINGAASWLTKLASITGLQAEVSGNSKPVFFVRSPRTKFSSRDSDLFPPPCAQLGLPTTGWTADNLKLVRVWSHGSLNTVVCELTCWENRQVELVMMWRALYPICREAIESGAVFLHGALLEVGGVGIVLAGSGGRGKSTCCARVPETWNVLSDDQTLILREHPELHWGHPFPTWSECLKESNGPRWNIQQKVPLRGVFFLEQAQTDEIIPIRAGESTARLSRSAIEASLVYVDGLNRSKQSSLKVKLFDNACVLGTSLPSFVLRVSLRGRFWEKIESALRGLGVHSSP